mgnify:CR=1 FL=1
MEKLAGPGLAGVFAEDPKRGPRSADPLTEPAAPALESGFSPATAGSQGWVVEQHREMTADRNPLDDIPASLRESFTTLGGDGGAARCIRRLAPNPRRKREYQLATEFWQAGAVRFVVKRAAPPARSFLLTVQQREQAARRFFVGAAEVVCGQLAENALVYPWINHPTLQAQIAARLAARDAQAGLDKIKQYVAFIQKLPGSLGQPGEFLPALGLPPMRTSKPVKCLEAGHIDLIPDNILVGNLQWHLCDHEFFFDWAIPADLIVFRGLGTLVNRLQRQIRTPDAPWSVVPFSGYFRRQVFIPVSWTRILEPLELPAEKLSQWSTAFERTVLMKVASSCLHSRFLRQIGQPRSWWMTGRALGGWAASRLWKAGYSSPRDRGD